MSARKLGQRCAEMGIDEAEIEATKALSDEKACSHSVTL